MFGGCFVKMKQMKHSKREADLLDRRGADGTFSKTTKKRFVARFSFFESEESAARGTLRGRRIREKRLLSVSSKYLELSECFGVFSRGQTLIVSEMVRTLFSDLQRFLNRILDNTVGTSRN